MHRTKFDPNSHDTVFMIPCNRQFLTNKSIIFVTIMLKNMCKVIRHLQFNYNRRVKSTKLQYFSLKGGFSK